MPGPRTPKSENEPAYNSQPFRYSRLINRSASGQFVAFISLAFSSDGSRLAAGGMDGSVTLWDLASLSQVAYWKAHARYATRVCFLDGGDALMTTGSANTDWDNSETRIWRPPSLAEIDATERAHSRLKRSE